MAKAISHPFEMGPYHYYAIIIYIYLLCFHPINNDMWLLKEVDIQPNERGEPTISYKCTNWVSKKPVEIQKL